MPITRPLLRLAPLLALALAGCGGDEPAPDAGLLPDDGPPPARDMRAPEPADGGPDLDLADDGAPQADAAPDAAPDMATGPACANGADDDGDGRADLDDPGCLAADDDDEQDPPAPPACANGLDDDDDGLTDYPADPDCAAAGGDDEGALCGALGVTTLDPAGTTTVRLWPRPPVTGASCGEAVGEAAVGTFAVTGPAIVRVSVEAPGPVRVFARARCRDRLSELDCRAPGEGAVELAVEGDVTLFVFVQAAPGFPDGVAVDVPVTVEVIPVADTCRNGLDDDGDGKVDQADPGCSGATDDDETDPVPLPECGNGVDDDGDGATDWPDDPECNAAGGLREGLACDGIEAVSLGLGRHALAFEFDSTVPGETRGQCGGNGDEAVAVLAVDRPASLYARVTTPEAGSMATYLRRDCRDRFTDAVCDAAFTEREIVVDRLEIGTWFLFFDHDVGFEERVDAVEATVELVALDRRACEDGADNDGDGRVDLADPGCARPGDDDEADPEPIARCSNGLDDDADGATDWPADPACPAAGSDAEGRGCLGDAPVIPVGEAGGTFLVDARPLATGTAIAACGGDLGAETVFALTLRRPADLRVRLDGAARFGRSRIFVRGDCADEDSERACATEGRLSLDALAEGTWYVFVELGETTQPGPPPSITFEVASLIGECNDELDNDGDGRVDLADPGCVQGRDPSEADPPVPPECSNGVDDDGDGATDWPDDAQCRAAGGEDEAPVCAPGVEVVPVDPSGGRVDVPFGGEPIGPICGGRRDGAEIAALIVLDEPSRVSPRLAGGRGWYDLRTTCDDPDTTLACAQRFDFNRPLAPGSYYLLLAASAPGMSVDVDIQSLVRQCNDALDNDGDGRVDLADPGCVEGQDDDEADPLEAPACADGLDNDGDGAIDWPDDPECTAAGGLDEDRRCPALGAELRMPAEGGEVDVDTRGLANVLAGSCGGGGAPEVAVTLHLDAPAQVVAEVVAADYDTLVYIIDGCDDRPEEAGCDDDSGDGNWSRVETRLDAGDWVIVVDGFGGNSGTATLRVDVVPELMP